jgi:hypothetical protein
MARNSGRFSLIIFADIHHYAKWIITHARIIYIQMWVCIIMQRELLFHHDLKFLVRKKQKINYWMDWKHPESFVPIVSLIKTYAFDACIFNDQHTSKDKLAQHHSAWRETLRDMVLNGNFTRNGLMYLKLNFSLAAYYVAAETVRCLQNRVIHRQR